MKKFFVLLTALTAFSLTGCNKVTYTEISEDKFAEYYTEEKVAAAQESFDAIARFHFNFNQVQKADGFDFIYNLARYFDEGYYYEYAKEHNFKAKESGDFLEDAVGHSLYLGNENVEQCMLYQVVDDTTNGKDSHEQQVFEGQQAVNAYQESLNVGKRIVSRSINNPIYIQEEFASSNLKYFKGSDGTLKVTSTDTTGGLKAYSIVNASSLLLLRCSCSGIIDVEENTTYTLKMDYKFSYNQSFARKTPSQIGYKEEE